METGAIKDQDITASSSFEHGNVGPHHGRYATFPKMTFRDCECTDLYKILFDYILSKVLNFIVENGETLNFFNTIFLFQTEK
jgi:hypothetical protein